MTQARLGGTCSGSARNRLLDVMRQRPPLRHTETAPNRLGLYGIIPPQGGGASQHPSLSGDDRLHWTQRGLTPLKQRHSS